MLSWYPHNMWAKYIGKHIFQSSFTPYLSFVCICKNNRNVVFVKISIGAFSVLSYDEFNITNFLVKLQAYLSNLINHCMEISSMISIFLQPQTLRVNKELAVVLYEINMLICLTLHWLACLSNLINHCMEMSSMTSILLQPQTLRVNKE